MYGNNFNPFMMPGNMSYAPYNMPRSLFSTGGIRNLFSGIHNVNWSGMLNNVSRTLGGVRDAIPVVKEVGPMINNMKSMIKIASVFKDETEPMRTNNGSTKKNQKENSTNSTTPNYNYNNEPNFFI